MRMIKQFCFTHLAWHKLAPLVSSHVDQSSTDKLGTDLGVDDQACDKLQTVSSGDCFSLKEKGTGPSRPTSSGVDHLQGGN